MPNWHSCPADTSNVPCVSSRVTSDGVAALTRRLSVGTRKGQVSVLHVADDQRWWGHWSKISPGKAAMCWRTRGSQGWHWHGRRWRDYRTMASCYQSYSERCSSHPCTAGYIDPAVCHCCSRKVQPLGVRPSERWRWEYCSASSSWGNRDSNLSLVTSNQKRLDTFRRSLKR
jgi:hypothetical protein